MVGVGRSTLRNLFDDAPTPLIRHPPRTHHLDYYLATDGSFREDGGGLGVIIETRDGRRVDRTARPDDSPDNNVAEYRALHLGLDVAATCVPPTASVGLLVDHAELARNLNAVSLRRADPTGEVPVAVDVPAGAHRHWRGILARLAALDGARTASIDGGRNPAHALANAPSAYAHLRRTPQRCVLPRHGATPAEGHTLPPSRAGRQRSD